MKKSVIVLLIFSLVSVFVFTNFISAIVYNCNVTTPAECATRPNGEIVMGLTALTDAHGQNATYANNPATQYTNVVCCNFGTGTAADFTCSPTAFNSVYGGPIPQNKILGLSSSTNSHAESTGDTLYTNNVCYTNLQCVSSSLGCSAPYTDNVVNLSADTNAHLGADSNYPIQICCEILSLHGQNCNLQSATWSMSNGIQNNVANLVVTGDANCADGTSVTFNVYDTHGNIISTSITGGFTNGVATGTWTAQYNTGSGTAGSYNNIYKFNATVASGSTVNSGDGGGQQNATLTITALPTNYCFSTGGPVTLCDDYNSTTPPSVPGETQLQAQENNCNSDVCGVAAANYPIYDPNTHTGSKDSSASSYGCYWNSTSNSCAFQNLYTGSGTVYCGKGYTLCVNSTSHMEYCRPYSCAPGDSPPFSDGQSCTVGKGCLSLDCLSGNPQDSCDQTSQAGTLYCNSTIDPATSSNTRICSAPICPNPNVASNSNIYLLQCSDCPSGNTCCYSTTTCPPVSAPPSGNGATGTATVNGNGQLTGVTITNGGSGFTNGEIVTVIDSYGNKATGTATVNGNGQLTGVTITNGGSGFTNGETIIIAGTCSTTTPLLCPTGLCYPAGTTCPTLSNTNQPTTTLQCGNGYTTCYSATYLASYCNPGSGCPPGDTPSTTSCSSADPTGQCLPGLTCNNGVCNNPQAYIGSCTFSSVSVNNTCENGFLTYSWTAQWNPVGNSPKPDSCKAGSSVIECPAQILLPFFTPVNAIITIIVVIAIYVVVVLVRKSKKHSASRNRRRKK